MTITAASLLVKVGADTSEAESGLKSFSGKMKNVGGQMAAVGGVLSATIAAPLLGIAVASVKTAADFEKSMNVLGYASGATAKQMQDLSDQALQLGADTVFSANEAAEGMVDLAKAGMKTEDIMGAIPGVMDLAAAGQIGVSEAANLTAAALNTFSLEATESGRVADVLAAAANASTAEVSDLAFGLQNAGSIFATNGQTVETLATMMALLANNGVDAGVAATSLKTMTLRLTAPTQIAAKAMKSLGLQVFDAEGNMRDYHDIIRDLEGATKDMTGAQKDAAFQVIFGQEAINAANIFAREGVTAYEDMNAAVKEQGASAAMASAQNSGLAGTIEQITGSLSSLATKLALPFLDDISAMGDKITEFINQIGELPQPVINAAIAFGIFAAAVALGVTAIGAGILLMESEIFGPIALIVLGILALGAAVAALWVAWDLNWGNIQGKTTAVIDAISPMISGLVANLSSIGTDLSKVWSGEGGDVKAPTFKFDFKGPAAQLTKMIDDLTAAVNKIDLTTIDWWGMLNRLIISPLRGAIAAWTFAAATFDNFRVAVETALAAVPWGDLGGALTGLKDAVIGQLGIVVNDIIADLTPLLFLLSLKMAQILHPVAAPAAPAAPKLAPTPIPPIPDIKIPMPKIVMPDIGGEILIMMDHLTQSLKDAPWAATGTVIGQFIGAKIQIEIAKGVALWKFGEAIAGKLDEFNTSAQSLVDAVAQWGVDWNASSNSALDNFNTGAQSMVDAIAQFALDFDAQVAKQIPIIVAGFGTMWTEIMESIMGKFIKPAEDATSTSDVLRDRQLGPKFEWPELPTWTWPEYLKFTWPNYTAWKWPDYKTFTWPDYLTFTWPAYLTFDWPDYDRWVWPKLPEWKWPDMQMPGWVGTLISILGGAISAISGASSGAFVPSPGVHTGGGGPTERPRQSNPNDPRFNAMGTSYFTGGATWVGEHGPEILNLPQGTRIYSNQDSMAMMAGGITINVNVASINNNMDIEVLAAQLARRFQQKLRL